MADIAFDEGNIPFWQPETSVSGTSLISASVASVSCRRRSAIEDFDHARSCLPLKGDELAAYVWSADGGLAEDSATTAPALSAQYFLGIAKKNRTLRRRRAGSESLNFCRLAQTTTGLLQPVSKRSVRQPDPKSIGCIALLMLKPSSGELISILFL